MNDVYQKLILAEQKAKELFDTVDFGTSFCGQSK